MSLIQRYVRAVGLQLPVSRRHDVEDELASLIADGVDAQAEKLGRDLNDAELASVIKQFGHPMRVAAGYLGNRGLIGPELFPVYKFTLMVTLVVILLFNVVGVGLFLAGLTGEHAFVAKDLVQLASRIADSLFFSFGMVTLVFAIMERTGANGNDFYTHWSPTKLPHFERSDDAKRGEVIFELMTLFIFILLFNDLAPPLHFINLEELGVGATMNNSLGYLFWPINVVALASIGLLAYVLSRNVWTPLTRGINIILIMASLVILFLFIMEPEAVHIIPLNEIGNEYSAEHINRSLRIGLAILGAFIAYDGFYNAYRMMLMLRR